MYVAKRMGHCNRSRMPHMRWLLVLTFSLVPKKSRENDDGNFIYLDNRSITRNTQSTHTHTHTPSQRLIALNGNRAIASRRITQNDLFVCDLDLVVGWQHGIAKGNTRM